MNTAKSEKKRIRNRRKQRDDTGRFSHHHRHSRIHQHRKSSQIKQSNAKLSFTHQAHVKTAKSKSNQLPTTTATTTIIENCNGLFQVLYISLIRQLLFIY